MKIAVDRVKKLSKDEKLRIIEENRERGRLLYQSRMEYIQDEGLKKGLEKGIKQGIEKGIEKGRRSERQAVAKRLIQGKFNNTEIVRLTGLTKEEVFRMRKKLKR